MEYRYKGIDSEGKVSKGRVRATSSKGLIEKLKEENIFCTSYKVVEKQEKILNFNRKISSKDLSNFSRTMKNNMKAGIPFTMAMDIVEKNKRKSRLRPSLNEITLDIKEGNTLKEAFERHGQKFPQFFKTMLYIGEESGQLQRIFEFMEGYYLSDHRRRKKLINISIYPILVMFLALFLSMFFIGKVLPKFFDMMPMSKEKLPWITKFYMGLSKGINKLGIFLIPIIILLIIFNIWVFNILKRNVFFQGIKYIFPVLKSLNLKKFSCRFSLALYIMLGSGIDFKSALEILKAGEEKYIGNKLDISIEEIMKGNGIYSSMKATNMFSEYFLSNLYIGEINGSLEEALKITNEVLEEDLKMDLDRTMAFLEPGLIILVGALIISMILSIVIPLFNTYNLDF